MEAETKTEKTARELVLDWMERNHAGAAFEFVPWSKSRSAKPGKDGKKPRRNFNYRVTVTRTPPGGGTRDVLTFDYSMGLGFSPTPEIRNHARVTLDVEAAIIRETEEGRACPVRCVAVRGPEILPDVADVFGCLALDYSILNYSTFEEWAPDVGFDPDSREGERVYRESVAQALALRNGFGEAAMQELAEAARDL